MALGILSHAYATLKITVTPTRSEQEAVLPPIGLVVISKEDMQASGVQNIADAINNKAGIQLSDLFGDGSSTQVGLRGFSETANANVLILVDGRRLNNADIGAPDLNSISLQYIDRIEIIQGSNSVLYGDQAVAGVVNIITSDPKSFYINLALSLGSYNNQNINLDAGNVLKNGFSYKLSIDSRESDNYRNNNKIEYENLYVKSNYNYGSGEVFLELQNIRDYQQTPGSLLQDEINVDRQQSIVQFQNDFSETDTDIVRLGVEQKISNEWKFLTEYTDRDADGKFRLHFRSCITTTCNDPASIQKRRLKTINPRLIGNYNTNNGPLLFTVGVDYEENDYGLSTKFGIQNNHQEVTSVYAQSIFPIKRKVDMSLGLRNASLKNELIDKPSFGTGVPDNADLDDDLSIFNIGFNFQANKNLRYFLRYEENYRFAKVDDHTQSPITTTGNVLETQEGSSIDVGFDLSSSMGALAFTLYKLDLDNEIAFNPTTFQNINVGNSSREGVTLSSVSQLNEKIKLGVNFSYIDAEVESGSFAGNEFPFVAKRTLGVHADYNLTQSLHIYTEVNYIDRRYLSGDFANSFDKLAGYSVVNMNIGYSRQDWTFSMQANNLFDEEYSSFAATGFDASFSTVRSFMPSPGRNFLFLAEYSFN